MKIGMDLDGVIAIHTIRKAGINPYKVYKTSDYSKIDAQFPDDEVIIITGRIPHWKKVTLKWLKKNKVNYKDIHFFPKVKGIEKTDETIIEHKVKLIKELGIERFYEDRESMAVRIKEEVPKCEVFIVREGNVLEAVSMKRLKKLKMCEEFESLMTPLTPEAYRRLEEKIRNEGFHGSKITTWRGYIVDGHHRYKICKKYDIEPETEELEFDNKYEVINWIYDHQLGRRNILPLEKSYLIHKKYEYRKKEQHRPKNNGVKSKPLRTREFIAKSLNISPSVVDKAHKFGKAVDKLVKYGLDKNKILSGEIKATQKDIITLASFKIGKRKAINKINNGKVKRVKDALLLEILFKFDNDVGKPLKMAVAKVNIKNIEFNPYNPNVMNEKMFSRLCKSIVKYGFINFPTLFYDKKRERLFCIDGEKRILAVKKLGCKFVPAYIVLDGMRECQAFAGAYTYNKFRGKIQTKKLKFMTSKMSSISSIPVTGL